MSTSPAVSTAYSQGCLRCASWVWSAVSLGAFAANRCAVAVDLFCQVAPRVLAWKIDNFQFFLSDIFDQAFNCTYVQGFQICTSTQYCPCRPREQTSSPPMGCVGVRVRIRSEVGLVWAPQPSFVRTCTWGAAIHKSLLNLRADLKNLARTCNFAGAGYFWMSLLVGSFSCLDPFSFFFPCLNVALTVSADKRSVWTENKIEAETGIGDRNIHCFGLAKYPQEASTAQRIVLEVAFLANFIFG